MKKVIILGIVLVLCWTGCKDKEKSASVSKGNRLIAVDTNLCQGGNYDDAIQLAKEAGAEVVGLFLQWNVLEPSPGVYDNQWLYIANIYYPPRNISLDLTIAPINTTVKTVPSDLAGKEFDDPEVIQRFNQLIDFVLSEIPDVNLHSLSIGSEMDIFFGTDNASWTRFNTFYDSAVTHIKSIKPEITITVETTFKGLMGAAKYQIKLLNENSDAIAVSYYPMLDNGDVADPSVVMQDFDSITTEYSSRPIFFYQFGYPSSAVLNSSEKKQADFIRKTFEAWDKHASRIELIDFTWLHDLNPADVQTIMEFYGYVDTRFGEFLGTLGLRTWAGEDKQAFKALKSEAHARGW
jgi:hypothetical protein